MIEEGSAIEVYFKVGTKISGFVIEFNEKVLRILTEDKAHALVFNPTKNYNILSIKVLAVPSSKVEEVKDEFRDRLLKPVDEAINRKKNDFKNISKLLKQPAREIESTEDKFELPNFKK